MKLPVNYNETPPMQRRAVREEYVRQQAGKCCHCGEPLNADPPMEILEKPVNGKLFPVGFFNHPVHLHHSHETGITIGAVHAYCNAVLWQFHGE